MFDDINFRKVFIVLALLGGAGWYASKNVDMPRVVEWAKARPDVKQREKLLYYSAMYYFLRDQRSEAAGVFSELLTEEATGQYEPKALVRMGRCYQDMRRFEEARAAYERYIEFFPAGPDVEIVKKNYEYVKFR